MTGSDVSAPRVRGLTYVGGSLTLDGAAGIFSSHTNAGERSEDSLLGVDHLCVAGEWKATTLVVSATGDLEVFPGPCVVRIVRVRKCTAAGVAVANTAGIILIKDGATVKESAAAAAVAGATLFDGLEGAIFSTKLVVNFANTGDTLKIEVLYRPLDQRVKW